MVDEATDGELLCSRAPEAFGRFYERHVPKVTAFVGRRVHEPELVFDLVAETFARALERRGQYDPARGGAVAWLFGIARNLMIDAARRNVVAADARVRLRMAPIALVEGRDALVRRFLLDQSYPEMATELHCSEQVVRKRVSRARSTLRKALEESE